LENGDGSSRKAALRISHAELAAMLGVSRERVSKQLAAWSDKGILEQGRGRLVVRDKQALEHVIANGSGQARSKRVDGSAHRLPARLQSRAAVPAHRRRFSAVLHADLAGFVRLVEGAEERGVNRVMAAQAEVWRPAIDTAGGRIVNTVGDSLLAEFSSAMAAVAAAIDIQERMAWFNDMLDEDQRLMFRIGLHLGEVIVDETQNFFGDGVDVAARIQLMAEPGGVVVSRAVRDATHLHVDHAFVDGGELQGRNISRSLQVYHVRARKNASTRTTTSIVPRATLRLRGTDRDGRKYAFDVKLDELMTRREGIVIGRDFVQCGLVVSHSTVSRRHARLIFAGGVLQVEDLGSTNGTSVDREEARPGNPQMLQAGVTLKIGEIELSVEGN
jgi:class 3 adenylate cyclase